MASSTPISLALAARRALLPQPRKALVLGSHRYVRNLLIRLRELGFEILFIESDRSSLNWLYADRTWFMDAYDLANHEQIVSIARAAGLTCALIQSDDDLLPQYFAVNRRLENKLRFSELALRCSTSKSEMRRALEARRATTIPQFHVRSRDEIARLSLEFPVISKAEVGQGAHGARFCQTPEEVYEAFAGLNRGPDARPMVIERYLRGRQFNVDGLVHEGTSFEYMVTEECYDHYFPIIRPCWFFFNIDLDASLRQRIIDRTREAIAACDIWSGGYHCELKFDGEEVYAIDLSNRLGADFPLYAWLTTGLDQLGDYVRSMHGTRPGPLPALESRKRLHFYNYPEHRAFAEVRKLFLSAETLLASDPVPDGGERYELVCDEEAPLRRLLDEEQRLRLSR